MTVDRAWAPRNLGFAADRPSAGENHASAADRDRDLRRELIDFDSETADLSAVGGPDTPASQPLSKFVDVGWPAGLSPVPGDPPAGPADESLPRADVLIVTWTTDEGHALSRVLTPGHDSQTGWKAYTKNFAAIAADMRPGCPAQELGRLGTYWTATIGDTPVTLFKSDSHMSQDGPKLPIAEVWRQIIADCQPGWVITTGTGGGIGPEAEVGDVLVSRFVSFDCRRDFAALNGESFASEANPPQARLGETATLFTYNSQFLPPDNSRAPRIVLAPSPPEGALTTDFFGFDNTADTYGLQGKGDLAEMGDAVLGMVCKGLGSGAPEYVVVRNVSNPEIDSTGLTLPQQAQLSTDIYKGYGRWSSVCSAIACWAIVAAI
jgi:hypothetical protein